MIGYVLHAEHINAYGIIVVAGAAFAAATLFYVYSKPIAKVPGPWYTNWTGLVFVYKTLVNQGPAYLVELHAQYGPTVRVSPSFVAISELEDVKQVYNTKETFLKSSFYNAFGNPLMPRSVFSTASIDLHRRYRRLLGGAMSESSLKPLTPEVHIRAERAVDRMEEEMKTRGAADIAKWLLFFTTDTIGDLTFGEGFNMLNEGKPNQYSMDLHSLSKTVGVATMLPGLVLFSRRLPFALKRINEIRKTSTRLNDYARQSIARQKAGDSVTLFSKIIKAEEEGAMTENELVANASSYLIAGTDTTANTLTFLIWAVGQNSEIREKLTAELAALPEDFTDADLKPLKYLDHVCQEALRLYPAAPSTLPRVVPPTGAVLGGYTLNPGTEVGTQAYTMHRNEEVFPEPLKFNPSRWENETKEMKDTMTAFGRGNRVCLGMHLALMEMRLLTALFFRRFPNAKMSSLEGMSNEDMVPISNFLASPIGGRCLMEA